MSSMYVLLMSLIIGLACSLSLGQYISSLLGCPVPSSISSLPAESKLCRMVSYNIGHLAYLNAKRYGLPRVLFGGFFIRGHPYTMETISFAIKFWSKASLKASGIVAFCTLVCNDDDDDDIYISTILMTMIINNDGNDDNNYIDDKYICFPAHDALMCKVMHSHDQLANKQQSYRQTCICTHRQTDKDVCLVTDTHTHREFCIVQSHSTAGVLWHSAALSSCFSSSFWFSCSLSSCGQRGIQCTPWLHRQENAKEEEDDDDVFFGIFLFLLLLLYPLEGAAKGRFGSLSGLCCMLLVLGCALAALFLSFFGPSAGDVCLWVHTG